MVHACKDHIDQVGTAKKPQRKHAIESELTYKEGTLKKLIWRAFTETETMLCHFMHFFHNYWPTVLGLLKGTVA